LLISLHGIGLNGKGLATEQYSHPEASVQSAVEILANFTQDRINLSYNENQEKTI
jgi:hypothetical protein